MMAVKPEPTCRGELRLDEPMARHTSWRVGGPARYFYRPADLEDLGRYLSCTATARPVLWLGLGSNLLVRDGGFSGTVIFTFGGLQEMEWVDAVTLRAGAGVTCSRIARRSSERGMGGAEFLAGIPGTLGGALAMNAGAFGGETWRLVSCVETMDIQGVHRVRTPDEYRIAYRSVEGPDHEWFVAAHLRLQPVDAESARENIRQLLEKRGRNQPTGQASCGSVFRNPPGDHAARLIETAGLKGALIGGAQVSEKHANFIINIGTATAADIESLIYRVQEQVAQVHGVTLETEVRIVGEPAYGSDSGC